jgi:hypothetical protein
LIPPDANAEFVYHMERVLDVHMTPYDPLHPKLGMDESPNQLIGETRKPYRDSNGVEREDFEYVRKGVASIFMSVEPLTGEMVVEAKETHNTRDWVFFIHKVMLMYPEALTITFVLDNLSTHKPSAFYDYFEPEIAKALLDRLRFVFTPKHGSWLNMAEIALHVLNKQCLCKRMPNIETMREHIAFWEKDKASKKKPIHWQFGIEDARVKLVRLYPKI